MGLEEALRSKTEQCLGSHLMSDAVGQCIDLSTAAVMRKGRLSTASVCHPFYYTDYLVFY